MVRVHSISLSLSLSINLINHFFFLLTTKAELCNIEIVNKHYNDIPFEVQITDQINGEAIVTAKRDLNCEKHRSYHFSMRAVSCTGQYSEKYVPFSYSCCVVPLK